MNIVYLGMKKNELGILSNSHLKELKYLLTYKLINHRYDHMKMPNYKMEYTHTTLLSFKK